MRSIVQLVAIVASHVVDDLLAEFVKHFLPFLASAVAAEYLANALFGDTDRGKTVGDVIAKTLSWVRISRVCFVYGDLAVAVIVNDAALNFGERIPSLIASNTKSLDRCGNHGNVFHVNVRVLRAIWPSKL